MVNTYAYLMLLAGAAVASGATERLRNRAREARSGGTNQIRSTSGDAVGPRGGTGDGGGVRRCASNRAMDCTLTVKATVDGRGPAADGFSTRGSGPATFHRSADSVVIWKPRPSAASLPRTHT